MGCRHVPPVMQKKGQPQTKTKSLPDSGGAFNPHIWEAEVGESLRVQGQSGVPTEFQDS